MKRGAGKQKGNRFEWWVARALSRWITGGADDTQLIPSRQSGGWSRDSKGRHAGDLAANGPLGETFRQRWVVECKARRTIDLWETWTKRSAGTLHGWWMKVHAEAAAQQVATGVVVQPLLIVRANHRPVLVALPYQRRHLAPRGARHLYVTGGDDTADRYVLALLMAVLQHPYDPRLIGDDE